MIDEKCGRLPNNHRRLFTSIFNFLEKLTGKRLKPDRMNCGGPSHAIRYSLSTMKSNGMIP